MISYIFLSQTQIITIEHFQPSKFFLFSKKLQIKGRFTSILFTLVLTIKIW